MTSIKALKRDMEIVRRALTPDSEREYHRKQTEIANRLFSELERILEYEAAQLTEETVATLSKQLNDDVGNIPNSEGHASAIHQAHIRDVLSLCQRPRNHESSQSLVVQMPFEADLGNVSQIGRSEALKIFHKPDKIKVVDLVRRGYGYIVL